MILNMFPTFVGSFNHTVMKRCISLLSNHIKMKFIILAAAVFMILTTLPASAQYYMNIRKSDGTSVKYVVTDIDSVWFSQTVKPIYGDTTGIAGDTIDNIYRTTLYIPGFVRQYRKQLDAGIFYEALFATHLNDSLIQYLDWNYPGPESGSSSMDFIENGVSTETVNMPNGKESVVYPMQRKFKYTFFIVPDAVLKSTYGINNLDELRLYAESVYPEGTGKEDYDRESSLNLLISYHILPFELTPNQLNASQENIRNNRNYLDEFDIEDFYTTMLPHSLVRISTAYDNGEVIGTFINRKGTAKMGNLLPGVKIREHNVIDKDTLAINGCYYLIDSLLCYNNYVRRKVLDTRLRFMATTLSPDFINSGARGRLGNTPKSKYLASFVAGFCDNFEWNSNSKLYINYRDVSNPALYGDEVIFGGISDIMLHLPPVPYDSEYEIRIWNNAQRFPNNMSYLHFYFAGSDKIWVPVDLPFDFGTSANDPRIGFVSDEEYDNLSPDEMEKTIRDNDKNMRNRGYMKSPDIYMDNRNNPDCYRKIICKKEMKAGQDYYLRIRNVIEKNGPDFSFSFIEIVPKSVYSGANGLEDRH